MRTLLINCRLIPELSGGIRSENGAVVINGSKIEAVYENAADAAPVPGDEITDCAGKTVIPGLIDMHMHMCTDGCGMGREYYDDFTTLRHAAAAAKKYMRLGFTTIRDMGSTNGSACAVRDMINEGTLEGPRVLACGRMILPRGYEEKDYTDSAYRLASGVDEYTRAVREEAGVGHADVIKIYASGSAYSPSGTPKLAIMFPEEIRACVKTAEFRGLKVAAHCHSAAAINSCIDNGVYTIEHASYIDETAIEKLTDGKSFLVPTLACLRHPPVGENASAEEKGRAALLDSLLEAMGSHLTPAYRAGLKMGFGTDTLLDGSTEGLPGAEFRLRRDYCGMSCIDMLLQATINSAELLGLSNVTGAVKAGLEADLLLIDGRPEEDIRVMERLPAAVYKGGKQVK